jgi:hypothetical protein
MYARARRERPKPAGDGADRPAGAGRLGAQAEVMRLQRAAGNQAVARLIRERSERAKVQRLVGFEVELSVPTFGPGAVVPSPGPGGNPAQTIADFFSGGYSYNTPLGQIPVANIDLKSDSTRRLYGPQQRLYSWLEGQSHNGSALLPNGGSEDISNLEYSTPALDEIAPGSNARFQAHATAIDNHAQALLAQNPATAVSAIQHGGAARVGVPVTDLQNWLGALAADPEYGVRLQRMQNAVQWDMYVQATVGVLPSGLPSLYQAQPAPAVQNPTPKDEVRAAVAQGIQGLLADNGFQTQIQTWEQTANFNLTPLDRDALRGALYLALSYAVGKAYNQTDLQSASAKNAVEFLFKMANIGAVATSLTTPLQNHPPPQALIFYAAQWFHANVQETSVQHWLTTHNAALGTDTERIPTYGTPHNPTKAPQLNDANALHQTRQFLVRLLTGSGGFNVNLTGGTPLGAPDAPSPVLPGAAVVGQQGVPLEYRWIATRPNGAGQLWTLMQTVLAEVRAANMAHVPAVNQGPIQGAW